MSEYQYYEFKAIDRSLSVADRHALRDLSSRAKITATSFKNSYDWGDFRGDPAALMRRWFDLHLYLADWGTRRLMIRLPQRLVRRQAFDRVLQPKDGVTLKAAGDNLILDIVREEMEPEDYRDDESDDSAWLSALAPLRADLLGGDLRVVYLLWLMALDVEAVDASEPEPLPGLGPMTDALDAFVNFFQIDPLLAEAAAERPFAATKADPGTSRRIVSTLPDREKTAWLIRLAGDDPLAAVEFRSLVRERIAANADAAALPRRTAGEIRARAEAIREARRRKAAEEEAARLRKAAAAEDRARRQRIDALRQRGAAAWQQVETEINRRNPAGYKTAHGLLLDLKMLADLDRTSADFADRLRSIRERHARKGQFIDRLKDLG